MCRSTTTWVSGLIVLCAILEGCGPDIRTLVNFDRARIPSLGNVGIVCVYEPVGPIFGSSLPTEERKELFRQASPAGDLRAKLALRIAPLVGPVLEISENDPEVVRIKRTRGLHKIDDYQVEKLNYRAIGDKYKVQTLIILRSWDYAAFDGVLKHLDLCADARMVDVRTGEILWRKRVDAFGCSRAVSPGDYSAADMKREFGPLIDCVVENLSGDFYRSP